MAVEAGTDVTDGLAGLRTDGTQAVPPGRSLPSWLLWPGVAAAVAAITVWGVWLLTHRSSMGYMLDVQVYLDGGRALRSGTHLYTADYTWVHLPFTYPPFAALAFAAVASLPLQVVKAAMSAATLASLFGVSWLCWGRLGYRAGAGRLGATLLAGAVAIGTEPVQQTLSFGQVNALLMIAVVADLCLPDRYRLKGVGIGLAAGFKLVPAIFIPYLLLTRRWRAAAVSTGTLAATVLGAFALSPHEARQYWGGLFFDSTRVGGVAYVGNQSLHGMIDRALQNGTGVQDAWILAAGATAVVGLLLAAWQHRRGQELAAVLTTAVTGLLASPISWSHHWVWILPALILGTDWAVRQARRAWLLLPGALLLLFAAWPQYQGSHQGTVPTGLIWRVPFDDNRELGWHGVQIVQGEMYTLTALLFLVALTAYALRERFSARTTPPAGPPAPAPAGPGAQAGDDAPTSR